MDSILHKNSDPDLDPDHGPDPRSGAASAADWEVVLGVDDVAIEDMLADSKVNDRTKHSRRVQKAWSLMLSSSLTRKLSSGPDPNPDLNYRSSSSSSKQGLHRPLTLYATERGVRLYPLDQCWTPKVRRARRGL